MAVERHPKQVERVPRVELPQTPEALQHSTQLVIEDIDQRLGQVYSAYENSEERSDAEQLDALVARDEWFEQSAVYETWLEFCVQIDELFAGLKGGAVAAEILELAKLSDRVLTQPQEKNRVQRLLVDTAPLAEQLRVLLDSVALLYPGIEGERVTHHISARHNEETNEQEYTLFGLMRELSQRLEKIHGTKPISNQLKNALAAWKLEQNEGVSHRIDIDDPLDAENSRAMNHWFPAAAIEARRGRDAAVVELSRRTSETLASDLHALARHLESINTEKQYTELIEAYETIANWIDRTLPLYEGNDPARMQNIDFFQESYANFHTVLQAFELLKTHDIHTQRLFMEVCGVHTTAGTQDASKYYGSIVHIAMNNTGRTLRQLEHDTQGATEGEAERYTMLRQIFDDLFTVMPFTQVDRSTLSLRSIREMAKVASQKIAEETQDPNERTQLGIMMIAGISPLARRALANELFKKQIAAELKAIGSRPERIAASEERVMKYLTGEYGEGSPYLTFMSLGSEPEVVLRQPRVRAALGRIYPPKMLQDIHTFWEECQKRNPEYAKPLYDRMPAIDMENGESGQVIKTALRDAQLVQPIGGFAQLNRQKVLETRGKYLRGVLKGRGVLLEHLQGAANLKEDKDFLKPIVDDYQFSWYTATALPASPDITQNEGIALSDSQEKERKALTISARLISGWALNEATRETIRDIGAGPVIMAMLPLERGLDRVNELFPQLASAIEEKDKTDVYAALLRENKRLYARLKEDPSSLDSKDTVITYIRKLIRDIAQFPPEQQREVMHNSDTYGTCADMFWRTIEDEEKNDERRPVTDRRFVENATTPIDMLVLNTSDYDDLLWSNIRKIQAMYPEHTLTTLMYGQPTSGSVEQRYVTTARRYSDLFALPLHVAEARKMLHLVLSMCCAKNPAALEAFKQHVPLILSNPILAEDLRKHSLWPKLQQ